jgi:hypothetical protein
MLKLSTGLRHYLLTGGSLKAAMDGGVIRLYSGTAPAPDEAPTGTLLVEIGENVGTPTSPQYVCNLDATLVGPGVISKTSAVWKGPIIASGTPAYYRYVEAADTGVASTTEKRIQGSVGVAGADLNLASLNLVASGDPQNPNEQRIDVYHLTLPESFA